MSSEEKSPERTFIHDILTPLSVVDGNIKRLVKALQEKESMGTELQRATKIMNASEKVLSIVEERRNVLRGQS